jgi:precorrin-6B C5,15-methyltransferase / cobalt-precorrin-6B C5,C15-methyltransferase
MITVVGCDGSPLPQRAMDRLGAAVLVAGGKRHLEAVRPPAHVRRVVMGDVAAALDAVEEAARSGAVVLASGDPGFFGIVRALRERGHAPEVLPAVSSVAGAFARAGLPWDDAVVVSAHGRDPRAAVNTCRAMAKTAVLTGPGSGPAELGAALSGWERTLYVAERLGGPEERVTRCTPAEAAARSWADPNLVLAVREPLSGEARVHNQPAAPPRTWLSDDLEHRAGMITKWEVRAVALARLRPTLGTLVWDVGAGSGSVGIACARHHAAVVAVERDPVACELIRRNAGEADVRVVRGSAPDALTDLPDPDAVFVGGGGLDALSGVLARAPETVVATFAAVDRAAHGRRLLADAGYSVEGVQLAASRFADLPGGSFRLDAQNPVFLLSGRRV